MAMNGPHRRVMHKTAPNTAEGFHFDGLRNFRISKTVKSKPPVSAAAENAHTTDSVLLSDRTSPINSTAFTALPIENRYATNGQL